MLYVCLTEISNRRMKFEIGFSFAGEEGWGEAAWGREEARSWGQAQEASEPREGLRGGYRVPLPVHQIPTG